MVHFSSHQFLYSKYANTSFKTDFLPVSNICHVVFPQTNVLKGFFQFLIYRPPQNCFPILQFILFQFLLIEVFNLLYKIIIIWILSSINKTKSIISTQESLLRGGNYISCYFKKFIGEITTVLGVDQLEKLLYLILNLWLLLQILQSFLIQIFIRSFFKSNFLFLLFRNSRDLKFIIISFLYRVFLFFFINNPSMTLLLSLGSIDLPT